MPFSKEKWNTVKDKVIAKDHVLSMLKKRSAVQQGFKDMRWYIIFVGLFCIITFAQLKTTAAFRTQNTLATWYVQDPWEQQKTLWDVGEWDDIWDWLEHSIDITWENWTILSDSDTYSGYTTISEYNALVGSGIYLKQYRSPKVTCPTSKLKDIVQECYDDDATDKSPFGTAVQFTYNDFMGGFTEIFHVSYATKAQALQQMNDLKNNNWIDRQTRSVHVEFYFYNGNTNFYSRAIVTFDLPPSGFVFPTVEVTCINVEPYLSATDYLRLTLELVFMGAVALAILVEFVEMVQAKKKNGSFYSYFSSAWNYFDVLSLLLFVIMIVMWIFYASFCTTFTQPALGKETYEDLKELQDNVDMFAKIMLWYHRINALNFFLVMIRFFKFVRFQGKMAILTNTISNSAVTIFHFLIVIIVVFTGFAMMGNFSFGHALFQFRTFSNSFNTCFRIILGDFDYDELNRVDPIGAFIFFWGLEILVNFIGLNMFVAILLEEYGNLKTGDLFTRTIFDEIKEGASRRCLYFKDMFNHAVRRKDKQYLSIANVIDSLKKRENDIITAEELSEHFGKKMAYKLLKHFGQDADNFATFSDDDATADDGFVTTIKSTLNLLDQVKNKRAYKQELQDLAGV